jgi:hypothetical protein
MDKGIGFSRTISLDWLDSTAALCLENMQPSEIREKLATTIQDTVHGTDAQRKTIDVLTAIWVRSEKNIPDFRRQALEIFPTLSSRQDRTWLHYGMTLLCYPLFRQITSAIGQIGRSQETITRKVVKNRVAAELGHLGALDRSVERIVASLTDWNVLSLGDEKNSYTILKRSIPASSQTLEIWLLTCALQSHPSDAIAFADLLHLPELFPFQFTVGIDHLRQDSHFDVERQGGGLDMVRVR